MKIKAIDGKLIQFPGLNGVYVGATANRVETKDEQGRVTGAEWKATFTGEVVELRPEGQSLQDWKIARIRDNSLAYWIRKVKDGDLEAADEEMAKLCGVPWKAPASAADNKTPTPALAPADKRAAATKG